MRPINLIVIHCSASPDGISLARFSPGAAVALTAAQTIDGWHQQRGFLRAALAGPRTEGIVRRDVLNPHLRHIGYHFVIDVDGTVLTGRGLDEPGAHAAGFNAESIGICLVGTASYTRAQWRALTELLVGGPGPFATPVGLAKRYQIPLASPQRRISLRGNPAVRVVNGVCGHRDLSPDQNRNGAVEPFEWLKTCPGFDVGAWLRSNLAPPPFAVLDPLVARAADLPTGDAHA
ncbi:N-acetylmuramoyl-L-alanine amidase [Arenimonas sp.]|uniref:N-acetylmuramoyl-L-alanine amidase n=1 Tax=Arenimonas sp. TaxID=1872635 RepID=UPI0025BAF8CD|nr:N-acetylmuramoyl-L-alanine amidase [Arenimonas sp.]